MHGPNSVVDKTAPSFRLQNYLAKNNSVKFVIEDRYNSDVASHMFENKMSVTRATAF